MDVVSQLRRGDLITVAIPGDYGKPRPALVIQSDLFLRDPTSITVLLLTSDLHRGLPVRIDVPPSPENGLHKPSQIMVDKVQTIASEKAGKAIGRLDDDTMVTVTRLLAVFLGFA